MQRYIRGLMLAGAAMVAWGCTDNPISDGAGDPSKVVATPGSIFMDPNDTVLTTVEVQDSRGAAIAGDFTIQNVGGGIQVEVDSSFNPYYNEDGVLVPPTSPTRVRLRVISGSVFGPYTFEVVGSGLVEEIPVRVLPTVAPVTNTATTAFPDETFTLTTSAPFLFGPDAQAITADGYILETVSVAADGSSMEIRAVAPNTGDLSIAGLQVDFIPGVDLMLGTTGGAIDLVGLPGTDGSAPPLIPTPPVGAGNSIDFIDFVGASDQFYSFSVTAGDTLDFEVNWDGDDTDIDILLVDPAFTTGSCAQAACTGNHPEHWTWIAPTTDTYFLWFQLYAGAAPPAYRVTISRPAADGE